MDAAGSAGHPGVAGEEAQLIAGLNLLYRDRWRFWRSLLGFHARRVGNFWEQRSDTASRYALTDPELGRLWALVQAQEDAPGPGAGGTCGGDEPPARPAGCVHNVHAGRAGGVP